MGAGALPTMAELGFAGAACATMDARSVVQFKGGETAGRARLQEYVWDKDLLKVYKETRNGMVGGDYSSKFSPWLAHGMLSARRVAAECKRYEAQRVKNKSTYWLIFELIWRDYMRFYCAHYGPKIYHLWGPKAVKGGKQWGQNMALFRAWCDGTTGVPFVDANMKELALTGFMSNRGRQCVASFLTRDLQLDWRLGAMWFEHRLIDHDPCQNYGNWTYAAGVGSDPREDRYFNLSKQMKNYDPQAKFVRLWLPELEDVPFQQLCNPHSFGPLTEGYPRPVCAMRGKFQGGGGGGRGKHKGAHDKYRGKGQGQRGGQRRQHHSGAAGGRTGGGGGGGGGGGRGGRGNGRRTDRKKKRSRVQHLG